VYLTAADKYCGPLASCLTGVNQPVIRQRNRFSVVYLGAADNISGPLPFRLRRLNQPVISTRNAFSTPRSTLLACFLAHVSHSNITIINRCYALDWLLLWPRWHPIEQHLFERLNMIGQSRRHRRCTRPPLLG
jgi:hypothetical protein